VSNTAKISGKLPDNGSHETLPAKAFLITEVITEVTGNLDQRPRSGPKTLLACRTSLKN
jgi:hypothetical protein